MQISVSAAELGAFPIPATQNNMCSGANVTTDFVFTRENTLRFSSAEVGNQMVAKFLTSCWRSRGWWARMRVRGTSTFTTRSETKEHSAKHLPIWTLIIYLQQRTSYMFDHLLPVDRGRQHTAERRPGPHDSRLLLLPQPVRDLQGWRDQRQQRLLWDDGIYSWKPQALLWKVWLNVSHH